MSFIRASGSPTGAAQRALVHTRPRSASCCTLSVSRGLVACASVAGKADANGSQFFITLERCDHLDRQSTIFGRVTGDTIFTALRIAEVEVDGSDRPVDAPRILSSDVLLPPFDDIVPRTTAADRRAAADEAAAIKAAAELTKRKQHGAVCSQRAFLRRCLRSAKV